MQKTNNSQPFTLVRPNELAERLRVSKVTLWRMEKRGELPAKTRVTSKVTGWPQKQLNEWFESLTNN